MRPPDVHKWFELDSGDRALVEVCECGAIGCAWHSDWAPTEMPHVSVCDQTDGYGITFTHSSGDTFRIDVARTDAVWARACARFRWWDCE